MDDEMYEKDEEVYDDDGREALVKDDEISSQEEAFMKGYEEAADEDEDREDSYDDAFEDD